MKVKDIVETAMQNSSLDCVHKVFQKYYHIANTNNIDVVLATVISYAMKGDPIWLIFFGASGDLKSSIVTCFEKESFCIKLDNLTPNTLASGKIDAPDLGHDLQQSSHLLIIPDLATLVSKNQDQKNEIWGQLRTLYDGYINKKTGSGVNKEYENCHVTLVACATNIICDEILIHAQLGTRDFMFDTGSDVSSIDDKVERAYLNVGKEQEIRDEIQKVIHDFLIYHPIKEHPISEPMKKFLKEKSKELSILRASGSVDRNSRELLNVVVPEVPTRLIKQFKKLYFALKSLDVDYPDEKCKDIISHVVSSSGNRIRSRVLSILKDKRDWCNIQDLHLKTKLSRSVVKQQLEVLWNIGILEKKIEIERVGGRIVHNYTTGEEYEVGGKVEEVSYYRIEGADEIDVIL